MTFLVWAAAGILAAYLVLVIGSHRQSIRESQMLTNLIFTLLLDDFAWRRQREGLIERIRELRVEDKTILHGVLGLEIIEMADKNRSRVAAIANRMWQMNQGALVETTEPREVTPQGPPGDAMVTLANLDDPPEPSTPADDDAPAKGFYQPPKLRWPEPYEPPPRPRPTGNPTTGGLTAGQRLWITRTTTNVRRGYARLRRWLLGLFGLR